MSELRRRDRKSQAAVAVHRRKPAFEESPGEADANAMHDLFLSRAGGDPSLIVKALSVTDRTTKAGIVNRLQCQRGNGRVWNMLRRPALPALQRAGAKDAGPAAGVGPAPAALPRLTSGKYIYGGRNFDAEYVPVGPAPSEGTLTVVLRVHIAYAPFTKAMMKQEPFKAHKFTRAQKADFVWKEAEKQRFANDFKANVQSGWSEKHKFQLNDPTVAKYQCRVKVRVDVVGDKSQAHCRITAQKVPTGAPELRSYVQGHEAVMDIRHAGATETQPDTAIDYVRQVGPFDFGKADLNPQIESQIREIEHDIRGWQSPTEPSTLLSYDRAVDFAGRASSKGSRGYNETLALRRAQAVEQRIASDLGRPGVPSRAASHGEEHATAEAAFQRVDVSVLNVPRAFAEPSPTATQSVAAHEAGHMFGLGDEYIEEEPDPNVEAKFLGDRPSHYGDVQSLIGTDAANELLVQDSGSIMSEGGEVRRGHYVYFLQAINAVTKKTWSII